jgi:hypothetical protein
MAYVEMAGAFEGHQHFLTERMYKAIFAASESEWAQ